MIHIGHSVIHVLPEISCKGLTVDDLPALLQRTQNLMQTEFDRLNAETAATSNGVARND